MLPPELDKKLWGELVPAFKQRHGDVLEDEKKYDKPFKDGNVNICKEIKNTMKEYGVSVVLTSDNTSGVVNYAIDCGEGRNCNSGVDLIFFLVNTMCIDLLKDKFVENVFRNSGTDSETLDKVSGLFQKYIVDEDVQNLPDLEYKSPRFTKCEKINMTMYRCVDSAVFVDNTGYAVCGYLYNPSAMLSGVTDRVMGEIKELKWFEDNGRIVSLEVFDKDCNFVQ